MKALLIGMALNALFGLGHCEEHCQFTEPAIITTTYWAPYGNCMESIILEKEVYNW